jgi:DNA primase
MAMPCPFTKDCLLSEEGGKQAKGYLLKRGMTRKTIDEFKIGICTGGLGFTGSSLPFKEKSLSRWLCRPVNRFP